MKNKYIIAVIIVVIIAGLYFLGKHFIKPEYGEDPKNPYDLNIDSIGKIDDNLYCNYQSSSIKLDIKKPKAIALGPDDNIFISGDSSVFIYDNSGKNIFEFKLNAQAYSIAVSKENKIFLGIRDHIKVYSKKGKLSGTWKSIGEKGFISSIALKDDNVFISDAEAELIYEYNSSGEKLMTYGSKKASDSLLRFVLPSYYFDIAIDPEGFLWAANTGKHKLVNLKSNGELRSYWGETSSLISCFCGCCNPTHFVILEDGSFITSEKGIVRVKKYDSAGQFVCAVAGPKHFKKDSKGLDIAIDSEQNIYVLEPMAQKVHIFKEK